MSNVKIINITTGTFAVFLLASSMASADTNYPASDFQPKVVYQDPDYKPAQSTAAASSATDSQYPAANFQPKVLYNDPTYQHAQSSSASAGSMQKSESESGGAASGAAEKKEESSSNYLIGLIVLALVGVVLFRKKSSPEMRESKAAYGSSGAGAGMTGVAKYLNRISGTGVSRYLEKQQKSSPAASAATGVAKYMAKQAESTKTTATEAKTGVEKYMRNRG